MKLIPLWSKRRKRARQLQFQLTVHSGAGTRVTFKIQTDICGKWYGILNGK